MAWKRLLHNWPFVRGIAGDLSYGAHGRPCNDFQTISYRPRQALMVSSWHHFIHVKYHYNDVIMSALASQVTSLAIVYPTVYSGADQRKKSKLRVTGPVCGEFTGDSWSLYALNTWRDDNVVSFWRNYVKITSFWRNNDAIIASCVCWVVVTPLKIQRQILCRYLI